MKILSRILALTAKPLNKQERLSTQMADVKSASPQKPVEPRMGENLIVTSCRRVASRKNKVQVCGLRMSRHKTAQVSTQEFYSRDRRSGCLLLAKGGKTFCKRRSCLLLQPEGGKTISPRESLPQRVLWPEGTAIPQPYHSCSRASEERKIKVNSEC